MKSRGSREKSSTIMWIWTPQASSCGNTETTAKNRKDDENSEEKLRERLYGKVQFMPEGEACS